MRTKAQIAVDRSAIISACDRYRYSLSRRISFFARDAVFIMLNPSTADAMQDDPTIRRCMGFAGSWGCGYLTVLNLFAFRATQPDEMMAAADPVGADNKFWFDAAMEKEPSFVVCAWGVWGGFKGQDQTVMGWLKDYGISPMCLGVTAEGFPKHPLYLKKDAQLIPYAGRP